MRIGQINIVTRKGEWRLLPIERSESLSDHDERQRQLRLAESRHSSTFGRGNRLRLYDATGNLVTEVE